MVDAQEDPWHLGWFCYLVLGMGTLFPWNAFITACDYFEAQYPGRHADRLFTVCYLPVNLLVLLLVVRHHTRVRPLLRIVGGFVGFTLAVSAVPLLDLAGPADATLGMILLLVALCGVCDGFAQGALFGDAASLPPKFTQALVSGTGVSGIAVCLLRVATKATLPDTPEGLRASANAYFSLAAVVCATCVVLYAVVLPRLPAIQYYRQAALAAALCEATEWGAGASAAGTPSKGGLASGGAIASGTIREEQQQLKEQESEHSRQGSGAGWLPGVGLPFRTCPPLAAAAAAQHATYLGVDGSSRGVSPEKLTDMVEEAPAPRSPAMRGGSTLSVDLELVPDDHNLPASTSPCSDDGRVYHGHVAGRRQSSPAEWHGTQGDGHTCMNSGQAEATGMGQALLSPLSNSCYSVAEEGCLNGSEAGGSPFQAPCSPGSRQRDIFAADGGRPLPSRLPRLLRVLWPRGGLSAKEAHRDSDRGIAAATGAHAEYEGALRLLWRLAASNVVIYTVTLSIFPGVLAEDVSSARLGSWYPVALITLFNFTDWAGKSLPGWAPLRLRDDVVILRSTTARALFVPAFLWAAASGAGPAVIGLLTLLLGLSNGYLTCCAMTTAPERVPPSLAALAGNLMVLSLVLGLCIGAACGFLWLL
ncbi:hypothetical protein N2152v2_002734 [Parachlorella kessleri]